MPLLAILDETAFSELPDTTVIGKDSFIKDEKAGNYKLAMDGSEAAKLAQPLHDEIKKLADNNKKLLDEKVKKAGEYEPFAKLGKTAAELEEILRTGRTPATDEVEKRYQAQIEGLQTEHHRILEAMRVEADEVRKQRSDTEAQLVSTMKRTRIAELKNKFDMNELADDYLANRIEVVFDDESGRYAERVIENGAVAYKGTMLKTPEQLAEEIKANRGLAGMFNGGTAAGTGAPPRQAVGITAAGVVNAGDEDSIAANLDKIASGEVKVV